MTLIEQIRMAQQRGAARRPAVRGFPYLAESLRRAEVTRIAVTVPSRTMVLTTPRGSVVQQGDPMFDGSVEVPPFDRDAFVAALRAEQEGRITYPEWLTATWHAGVTWYGVDLERHTCTYRSPDGDSYVEEYAAVDLAGADPH